MNEQSKSWRQLLAGIVMSAACSFVHADNVAMIGEHVTDSVSSATGNWTSAARDCAARQVASGIRLEDAQGNDGRRGHRAILLGEITVDVMPPGSLDENRSIECFDDDGTTVAVVYGDQQRNGYRVNGFPVDIPYGASLEGVETVDDEHVRVIWRDSNGQRMACVVENIQTRQTEPYYTGEYLRSAPYHGERASEEQSTPVATTERDEPPPSSDEPSPAESSPPPAPIIPEPGNRYGIDPVLSDGEVEMVAREAIERIRASYHVRGGQYLNEWGVLVGDGIHQSGGIDGYETPVQYWLLTNADVRGAVAAAAQRVRSQLTGTM